MNKQIPNSLTIDKVMIDSIAYHAIKNTIHNGTDRIKQEYMLHQTIGVITIAESLKALIDLANQEPDAENTSGNGDIQSGDENEEE